MLAGEVRAEGTPSPRGEGRQMLAGAGRRIRHSPSRLSSGRIGVARRHRFRGWHFLGPSRSRDSITPSTTMATIADASRLWFVTLPATAHRTASSSFGGSVGWRHARERVAGPMGIDPMSPTPAFVEAWGAARYMIRRAGPFCPGPCYVLAWLGPREAGVNQSPATAPPFHTSAASATVTR